MSDEIIDVVPVGSLHDVRAGDLVVTPDGRVIGTLLSTRENRIRSVLAIPDNGSVWTWRVDLLDMSRSTLPVVAPLPEILAEHGIQIAKKLPLEVLRPIEVG